MDTPFAGPTANALRTLELLQVRPGIGAAELAERLGVSDRAVRRYIAILREAGVSIDSVRGPYGGYRIGRSLKMPPLLFDATEALGLVMAVLDGHHAAADPLDPVGSAIGKLIGSLPGNVGRQAATMRRHALAAPDRRAARPDPQVTGTLVGALSEQRAVRLSYTSDAGASWESDVDPWAVVVRHGRWYLLGVVHLTGAARALRVDRIDGADVLDVPAAPPVDLDPVAWLERHLGSDWPYETHVEFDAPFEAVARYVHPPMGRLEPIDDGARCVLRGTTGNPAMYAGEWLAAIPHPCVVVGGPELRDAVSTVARRLLAAIEPP